ncbi:MAG: cell division protein SepF [Oscillospiraceae bacterium]|nr:cell division protein SepF [Oscillospiraceae bacterium]MBR4691601.1 cell division protein SepF [Oscillospiraceae bacterium]
MGIWDNLKKIARPYDEDTFDDYEEKQTTSVSPAWNEGDDLNAADRRTGNKVVNIHATARLQVVLVMPEQYEAAREIADHLRDKRTVVLNLENTSKDVSRRILDFVSGVAYAQDGKIKKVAVSTFIVTPYNVDILGDLIDELENNGVYF